MGAGGKSFVSTSLRKSMNTLMSWSLTVVREDAPEHVQAYWDSVYEHGEEIDETENATTVKGKRGRSSAAGAVSKREKLAWSPPAGSWEDDIDRIDSCEEDGDKLIVHLIWKNGKTTKHDAPVIYKKCPQKVGSSDRQISRLLPANHGSDAAVLRKACQDCSGMTPL